ncbi:fungal-specific transcription factor domain-containing protein [Mycena metata]|uniref:Fungal-specific transcription factor domain-containing protein n=1 Tax=Mycena metata TaxID=1033252 RepID=A0AAD7P131_9AGAR|nr:fungal-specific transcription factor domain-containing protein [Mycena metata]
MHPPSPSKSTFRKVNRSCDSCRKRKTRCDGPSKKDNICTNCVTAHKPCTYLEAYVTGLEDRLEQLEDLLKRVRPDTDFTAELGPPIPRDSWKDDSAPMPSTSRVKPKDSPPAPGLRLSTRLALNAHARRAGTDSDSSSDDSESPEVLDVNLNDGKRKLTLQYITSPANPRKIETRLNGKSSIAALLATTKKYRDLHISETAPEMEASSSPNATRPLSNRPRFWTPLPWELQWEGVETEVEQLTVSAVAEFPPPSLAARLIDLYFTHVNAQLPLLHRPTFERQFTDQLHHRNPWFCCVCLCIFATASRWCDDPLVLPRNCNRTSSGGLDWTWAGRHYHNVAMGIHRIRQSLLYPACLEEIQAYSLLGAYVRGTVNHSAGWIFVSIGLRKAQELGAHRKKLYSRTPNVTEELWKRAFWCLVAYDRFSSAILGRPCAIGEEDFDLDLCLEIDDEYWDLANPPFRQPPGVPCRITYFNLWLRLSQIVTFTIKTIYAVHNPRALLGRIAKIRTEEVIAQLNLALQEWLDSLPEYLQWTTQIKDADFSNQSASLHTTYHLAQMLMYRAFIPPVASASSPVPAIPPINVSLSALTYCIAAARSSARIVEVQVARGWTNTPILIAVSQLSAAILTLAVWDAKAKQDAELEDVKPPVAQTIGSLMDDIAVFINALESLGTRWENVPNLILVLKRALPKEEDIARSAPSMRNPAEARPDSNPIQLHTFDESDPENWSLPYYSSSVRTRQSHESLHKDPRMESGSFDKRGERQPWDAAAVGTAYAAEPSYPRVHFDQMLQDHSYIS